MARDANRKSEMTPEQKQVIDRLMGAALKTWDRDLIQRCAESGADTQGLLQSGISRKDAEMVRLALSYGADVTALVSAPGGKYQPILHYAHENFDEPVFSLILSRGVPIDLKNPAGETVAELAARKGDFERMRFYVDRGADISGAVQDILFSAIAKKNAEMVRWSLEQGADVAALKKQQDGAHATALHIAFASFDEQVAGLLLKSGLDVNARASNGETVLHLCAREGDPERTKFFLARKADPLAAAYDGTSVLDEAMKAVEKAKLPDRSSDRDSWRYGSGSSSFNEQARKEKQEKTREVLTLLLDKVKEDYGRAPYNVVSGRTITVNKPVTFANKKPGAGEDVKEDAKPETKPLPPGGGNAP
ncbi:MAG: hypothetical protein GC185_12730 [Alphaproteobacteria bacterium]|nr:hypothetical protein [Alphaproteobacteria bacterium]